jgi:hypothetical protein
MSAADPSTRPPKPPSRGVALRLVAAVAAIAAGSAALIVAILLVQTALS